MKFSDYLNENTKKLKPTDYYELIEIVKETISKEGNSCNLNFIDTSEITRMPQLFSVERTKNFNGDISEWDVSNVYDMNDMFKDSKFNGDISKWDVSEVCFMRQMFRESFFNGDISKWNVSNVKDMNFMFTRSKFNQDISNWDVSNVENMAWMFRDSPFNQDISKWDVSSVEPIYHTFMFKDCPLENKPEYQPKFKR